MSGGCSSRVVACVLEYAGTDKHNFTGNDVCVVPLIVTGVGICNFAMCVW